MIESIGRQAQVELLAIGIAHDVSRYYPRALRIFDADDIASAVMREFGELLAPPQRRKDRRRQP